MHKISLKDWVILLTIVPTTVICLFIGSYFSYSRYVELNDFLSQRASSIIQPLAIASVDYINKKERDQLRQLIGFAHRSQSDIVKSITIFTTKNEILVTSAYNADINQMRLPLSEAIPLNLSKQDYDDFVVFRAPIIDENNQLNKRGKISANQQSIGYIAIQIDKDKVAFHQQSQMLVTFSIVVFGAIISALFSLILIRNVTRPISSMVQAVDRIREGKLESRITGQLISELNFLKNGVNSMAQSLEDYQTEMQSSIDQATIDLRESLEQFEIQNVELDIAKRKAQDANKVKSEFLANMSHELRTPLNGVIGFTRQVLKTPLSNVQRDYLQTIEHNGANLLALINDILDFSKLDAGKMVIEKIPFSVRDTIEETLTLLAPSAHQKNIELSMHMAPSLPDNLIGDAMRIKQVLLNLANNAIKFTDDGSVNIDIHSEQTDSRIAEIKVTITDTGIGMNKSQQNTIFEAFGQADKSVTRLYGGTGLGLVISKRLVEEMNGKIGFMTEENQGSTFWFTFKCELNAMPVVSDDNSAELANKRVLYFEEQHHSRNATSEIMTNWGMQITQASSLKQLTSLLEHDNQYDFALIGHDVSPSAVDELKDLIIAIKPFIPSVHLTVNSNSPNLHEALIASGASSCLSKPVTPKRLSKVLLPATNDQPIALAAPKTSRMHLKVLAVDDNEANLTLIKALLLEQVDEVFTATNGQEALELCKSEKFSMIFMDIQMPVMDGVTALKHIKADTFNDQTPIIAVTAHALNEERIQLLEQGFDSYMTKPINESMLRHTIYEYGDLKNLTQDEVKANAPVPEVEQAVISSQQSNNAVTGQQRSDTEFKQPKEVASVSSAESSNTIEPSAVNKQSETEQIPKQASKQASEQVPGNTPRPLTWFPPKNHIIDWPLAVQRAGNKEALALDMMKGLVASLAETKAKIAEALESQNSELLQTQIHKLNGACCYSGVPSLGKITHQLETDLKKGITIDALEPEFLEFFEHLDNVLAQAPEFLENYQQQDG